ncbi:MAG: HsdM family class I SAM-dependent methyltransferase [Methanobacteriota archaeon]
MRGHVPTPEAVVDFMLERLFGSRTPTPNDRVLDPGCGTGPFVEGVLRWCQRVGVSPPRVVGIDVNPALIHEAKRRVQHDAVQFVCGDFLAWSEKPFDYVVGNPPYVSILQLSEPERVRYRARFATASGRLDLYMLFMEQGLRHLRPGGRLAFITPEKYQYVNSARPLRHLMTQHTVEHLDFLSETTFADRVAYPLVTSITKSPPPFGHKTCVRNRAGREALVELPADGRSWAPPIRDVNTFPHRGPVLEDICVRISCGVATGADEVYVVRDANLPPPLERFAHPTISGRQLSFCNGRIRTSESMLVPYDRQGRLCSISNIGPLADYLAIHRDRLERRTCVQGGRKAWWGFHDNAPLPDLLRPKILCKDITREIRFWVDWDGAVVPRHSAYYLVPKDPTQIPVILEHLQSPQTQRWIEAHVQHAANGFLRLQSSILRRVPISPRMAARGLARWLEVKT